MPVPWPDAPSKIPRAPDRAITVYQLRSLRIFLQRLCKTGQLKQDAQTIHWYILNMYHISDLVLRPVIMHLHTKRKCDGPPKLSWVELVATGSQPPTILMSHSWSGYFRDFMEVVDKLVSDRGYHHRVAIWVCTFANSQFGENFGAKLEASPFYCAISMAEGTVLVVDRDAGSLSRIWCSLEIHFTDKLDKDLQVYTPSGRIGSELVTSGPLVEALADWDVTCCEATQPCDRRQILNYLADPARENDGLAKDATGSLKLEDGWKKLMEDDSTDPSIKRANGLPEYQHEAKLFKTHGNVFSRLNQTVRSKVRAVACGFKENSEASCKIAAIEERGVHLGQIRAFFKSLKSEIRQHSKLNYSTATTRTIVEEILEKRYVESSYAETVNGGPVCPQYSIEHQWEGRISDLVAGIEWFAEARQLSDCSRLFVDVLALRRHGSVTEWDAPEQAGAVVRLNRNTDGRAFLWPGHGVNINRAWFMHAFHVARKTAKVIDFVCATGAMACTVPFPNGSWAFGTFDEKIAEQLVELDARECKATLQKDVDEILEKLSLARGGLNRFHHCLRRIAAGPVIRAAARGGSAEDISKILRLGSGMVINSTSLQGSLGHMATHVAAAHGNVAALEALLNLGADPNAEDHIHETPLHYAAFSGHLDCVKLLLSRSANTAAESAFCETPLDVAMDNVAEFCGVETKMICTLLEVWDAKD